jgi:ABC-2 type transport system permease protein
MRSAPTAWCSEPASNGMTSSPLFLLIRVNALQSWRRLLAVRHQSRLLTFVIGSFLAGYLGLAFWLFWLGLERLGHFPGVGSLLVERLFYLLFGILFVLLLLSNVVIGYTNFFRNRETQALLSLPVTPETIFQWKCLESVVLASWAFLFLIAPFLGAYGLTHGARWHFYPLTVLLIGLFIILPGVGGAWLALLVARYVERRTFQVVALALAAGLVALVAIWLRPEPGVDEMMETRVLAVLDKVLVKTRLAQYPFLPSYWLASSVLQWSEGVLAGAAFFLLVLLSTVLFFGFLALTQSGRFFYEAISAVQSRGSVLENWSWLRLRRSRCHPASAEPGRLERWARVFWWWPPEVRALLVKDTRMFWRDTSQWAQTVMLFGLLGVYILNLRHFSLQLSQPFWVHLVSHLNLMACSLNLATLTTRFVYPQFSLEGKRLWIVGMAPLGMENVVKTKFALALTAALTVTVGLILLSCHMLNLSWDRTLYFTLAVGIMSWTLTGLAVGLGILYPNFKEDHPGKIVSGFGGTFCLVLSFLYILGSVVLLGFGAPWTLPVAPSLGRVAGCLGGFAVISIGLGWAPFMLGLRRLRTLEL